MFHIYENRPVFALMVAHAVTGAYHFQAQIGNSISERVKRRMFQHFHSERVRCEKLFVDVREMGECKVQQIHFFACETFIEAFKISCRVLAIIVWH